MRIAITLNEVVRDFKRNFIEVYENYIESLRLVESQKIVDDIDWEEEIEQEESQALYDELLNGVAIDDIQEGKIEPFQQMDLSDTPLDAVNAEDFVLKPMEAEEERTLLNLPEHDDIGGVSQICKFIDKADYQEFVYEDMAFQLFGKTNPTYTNAVHDLNALYQLLVGAGHSVTIVSQERKTSIPATHLFLAQNNFRCNNTKFLYDYSQIWELYDLIITADSYIIKTKPKNKLCFKINSEFNKNLTLLDKTNDKSEMSFDNLAEVRGFYLEKSKEMAEA